MAISSEGAGLASSDRARGARHQDRPACEPAGDRRIMGHETLLDAWNQVPDLHPPDEEGAFAADDDQGEEEMEEWGLRLLEEKPEVLEIQVILKMQKEEEVVVEEAKERNF